MSKKLLRSNNDRTGLSIQTLAVNNHSGLFLGMCFLICLTNDFLWRIETVVVVFSKFSTLFIFFFSIYLSKGGFTETRMFKHIQCVYMHASNLITVGFPWYPRFLKRHLQKNFVFGDQGLWETC